MMKGGIGSGALIGSGAGCTIIGFLRRLLKMQAPAIPVRNKMRQRMIRFYQTGRRLLSYGSISPILF